MTNLTTTFEAAVNALLEEQKATDITTIHEVNDDTIITDITFTDKEGDIAKRMLLFGLPETEEIEANCDLMLSSIITSGGTKNMKMVLLSVLS